MEDLWQEPVCQKIIAIRGLGLRAEKLLKFGTPALGKLISVFEAIEKAASSANIEIRRLVDLEPGDRKEGGCSKTKS